MGRYERAMRATVREWQEQANLLRPQSLSEPEQRQRGPVWYVQATFVAIDNGYWAHPD